MSACDFCPQLVQYSLFQAEMVPCFHRQQLFQRRGPFLAVSFPAYPGCAPGLLNKTWKTESAKRERKCRQSKCRQNITFIKSLQYIKMLHSDERANMTENCDYYYYYYYCFPLSPQPGYSLVFTFRIPPFQVTRPFW